MDPATGQLIGTGMGIVAGQLFRGQQMKDQQRLMAVQLGNQMKLNKQGHELQKQMWDYTNYENQVAHMQNAGLNVGLMYGMGGGGGVTAGGQGGGSAQSGNAPTPQLGAMQMGLDLATQQANIELMKSQANKNNVEAKKTGGVDTDKVQQEIANLNSTKIGQDIQNALNSANFDTLVEMANTNLENAKKDGTIKDVQIANLDAEYKASIANKIADTSLKKAQESLTNQQEKESVAKILQGWTDLNLKNKGLNIEQQKANIQAFVGETQRNNPSLINAAGGIVNRGLKAIYNLFGMNMEDKDTKVPKE